MTICNLYCIPGLGLVTGHNDIDTGFSTLRVLHAAMDQRRIDLDLQLNFVLGGGPAFTVLCLVSRLQVVCVCAFACGWGCVCVCVRARARKNTSVCECF